VNVIAEVLECKPVISDGAVRHRLLMRTTGGENVAPNTAGGRS
jgi:hypothetical protein